MFALKGGWWLLNLPFKYLITYLGYAFERKKIRRERIHKDAIRRANWLCERVIVKPRALLDAMPKMLGAHYGGEWAIYSCSMLAAALTNISRLFPEEKKRNLIRLEKIIEIILSPELRQYDAKQWKEDPLSSLVNDRNSHMTYLSILAWTITNYKLVGGGEKFDGILHECCAALYRRMMKSPDLNLRSFPAPIIFLPDMLVAIVALKNYSVLYKGKYADIVSVWISKAKSEWLDKETGLLLATLSVKGTKNRRPSIRGSYTALSCYYLTLIDPIFAKEQYDKMAQVMYKNRPLFGVKEYLKPTPSFFFDADAGPVMFDLSPSGTAFAIGSATYFNDDGSRFKLLRSGEIVGQTIRRRTKRHYRLGELVLVGEATVLAMKTNLSHFDNVQREL